MTHTVLCELRLSTVREERFFFVSVTEEERGREKEFAWATKRKEKKERKEKRGKRV